MNRFLTILLLFAFPVLPGAELTFYAPFDGSAEAAFAAGEKNPREIKNLRFAPGVKGEAVRLDKKAHSLLRYAAAGNIATPAGTVSLWFKPEWDQAIGARSYDARYRRTLISMTRSDKERNGSGAVWFWCWGDVLRGDTSDTADSYQTTAEALRPGVWHHLAFAWDETGSELYINGCPRQSPKDYRNPLKPRMRIYRPDRRSIPDFFVGGHGNAEQADGLIDELRIYSGPLSPGEVAKLAAEFSSFETEVLTRYPASGEPFRFRVSNLRQQPREISWQLGPRNGKLALGPGESREIEVSSKNFAPGEHQLTVSSGGRDETGFFGVLRPENPYIAAGELKTTPVETLTADSSLAAERFVSIGKNRMGSLDGKSYLEAGSVKDDRFAIRFQLPDADGIYLLEWDYPDDKERTCEVIAQSGLRQGEEYELQTGYLAGGEYANSNRMLTQRVLYFPRSTDITLIFMTARTGMPAAVSEIRVRRVEGGLPAAKITEAPPVGGNRRTVGVYYEDPAFIHGFGRESGPLADFETVTDRLAAYMRFSGQNMLLYPVVWYHGHIGENYMPRPHVRDFLEVMLARFDLANLEFMAAFNQHNIQQYPGAGPESYHASAYSVYSDGKPNPGGWHGTPPNFNILHPDTQKSILDDADRILDAGAKHPSFKGIVLHLTRHTMTWFGDLSAGYNDYMIDGFTRDTGIRVPVDRRDPLRGKHYAEWLLANAREQWIDWRCRKLAEFYCTLADRIAARRPDLRLGLHVMGPISEIKEDSRFSDPGFARLRRREAGLDPEYLKSRKNIILSQTLIPADSRWRLDRAWEKLTPAHFEYLKNAYDKEGFYSLLRGSATPWIHMHDRYFESAVGAISRRGHKTDPLKAPWLRECTWRVSTLNPAGVHAMKHYVLPFRFGDVLGVSKGGFLIGTYGMEEFLTPFAQAFRALPAKVFADLPVDSQTIRARRLVFEGNTYFYVVNTDAVPGKVNVSTGRKAENLATGEEMNATFTLELQPYTLHSFRIPGDAAVKVR